MNDTATVVVDASAMVESLSQRPDLPMIRVSHRSLLRRMWELRDSVTPYDAAYVALAEELTVPLITCDAKLARSHGHHAKIELYSVN